MVGRAGLKVGSTACLDSPRRIRLVVSGSTLSQTVGVIKGDVTIGKHAVEILQGFEGILQVDGYAGNDRVLDPRDNDPIQVAYCWAHARRKLFELTHSNMAPCRRARPQTDRGHFASV